MAPEVVDERVAPVPAKIGPVHLGRDAYTQAHGAPGPRYVPRAGSARGQGHARVTAEPLVGRRDLGAVADGPGHQQGDVVLSSIRSRANGKQLGGEALGVVAMPNRRVRDLGHEVVQAFQRRRGAFYDAVGVEDEQAAGGHLHLRLDTFRDGAAEGWRPAGAQQAGVTLGVDEDRRQVPGAGDPRG